MKLRSFHNHFWDHGRREVVDREFGPDITIVHDKMHWLGLFVHVAHHAKDRAQHVHETTCRVLTETRARRKTCNCSWRDVLPRGDIEVSLMYADKPYRSVLVPDEADIEPAIAKLIGEFDELDFKVWLERQR